LGCPDKLYPWLDLNRHSEQQIAPNLIKLINFLVAFIFFFMTVFMDSAFAGIS
jgi:hypothetical protein